MFSHLSNTTLKNSANFKREPESPSRQETDMTKRHEISAMKPVIEPKSPENRNFIIIESLNAKRDSMISEHTKSPKSSKSNVAPTDFLHVFSTEFLTKEGVERDEKMVKKAKFTPMKVIEMCGIVDDPKIITKPIFKLEKRN